MTKDDDPLEELRKLMEYAVDDHRFDAARVKLQATFDRIADKIGLNRHQRIAISLANAYRYACEMEDRQLIEALEALLKTEDAP